MGTGASEGVDRPSGALYFLVCVRNGREWEAWGKLTGFMVGNFTAPRLELLLLLVSDVSTLAVGGGRVYP